MTISMYQASKPAFGQMLKTLAHVLKKAEDHCEAKKIDPNVLLNARLYPDMAPLSKQIQIATDQVKGSFARIAGKDVPSWPDEEKTFADLQARVKKAQDFLATVKADEIDGQENRDIKLKLGPNEVTYKAETFLINFSLPNFYFHVVTAYDILRHNGVEIGKRDFLGAN